MTDQIEPKPKAPEVKHTLQDIVELQDRIRAAVYHSGDAVAEKVYQQFLVIAEEVDPKEKPKTK